MNLIHVYYQFTTVSGGNEEVWLIPGDQQSIRSYHYESMKLSAGMGDKDDDNIQHVPGIQETIEST